MKRFTNKEIADILREMAVFYSMESVAYKPQAYENAANGLAMSDLDAAALFALEGKRGLRRFPGVGEGIADHIATLLRKGTFPEYRKFKKKYPMDVLALTSIEGIGPKTTKLLYEKLRIKTMDDLRKAATAGKIGKISRLGEKAEEHVLKGIKIKKEFGDRKILGYILPLAMRMEDDLRAIKGVRRVMVTGSVRRRQETIGDLDYIVTTDDVERVTEAFIKFPEVVEVINKGSTMTTVRLANGMHADIRIVPDENFGAAIQYFTGDKKHNIKVRILATKKGLMLNEYGIWKGKKIVASRTEKEIYAKLGMDYMDPEIRTDSGEVEAALEGSLPALVPYGSVRGDLQVQSDWTDGAGSIEEMAKTARSLGREYMAITDHTRSLAMAGGLDEKRLAEQGRAIDRINRKLAPFVILKGSEVNIGRNGSLDIKDAALAKLDIVGASVHSHFRIPRAEQTKRIIVAMEHPHVDFICHPTGRKIHRREPYDVDIDALLAAAKRTGTAMEINCEPDRSDLKDMHVRKAVALGVKLLINSDAHEPAHLRYLDLGVAIARRGWAQKKDILNTQPVGKLLAWLRKPKPRR